jgi:hypothetical protein
MLNKKCSCQSYARRIAEKGTKSELFRKSAVKRLFLSLHKCRSRKKVRTNEGWMQVLERVIPSLRIKRIPHFFLLRNQIWAMWGK